MLKYPFLSLSVLLRQYFCGNRDITNVSPVTFDQLNAFLLSKSIKLKKKNLTDHEVLNGSVYQD